MRKKQKGGLKINGTHNTGLTASAIISGAISSSSRALVAHPPTHYLSPMEKSIWLAATSASAGKFVFNCKSMQWRTG